MALNAPMQYNAGTFFSAVMAPNIPVVSPLISPAGFDDRSNLLLLVIAGHESNWQYRSQVPVGYAHSYWQFETEGVEGVLQLFPSLVRWLANAYSEYIGEFESPGSSLASAAWAAMALPEMDGFSMAMARLLLWSDPRPLPAVGDLSGAYQYYLRNWRPGGIDPNRFERFYHESLQFISP